jgi:hypothetical protein
MGDGKLLCCGSSLFLKSNFGVGYNMTLEKSDPIKFNSSGMIELIQSHIPDANLLTDVGAEMTFQLPFSASTKFQSLFRTIDARDKELGIESYGMSVTTLEEVFIRIAQGTTTQAKAVSGRNKAAKVVIPIENDQNDGDIELAQVEKPIIVEGDGVNSFRRIDVSSATVLFNRHVSAMLQKRALYFVRDTKAWVFQYVVPVLALLAGLLIVRYTTYDEVQPKKNLTPHMYNDGIKSNYLPTPYNGANFFCLNPTEDTCYNVTGQHDLMNSIDEFANFPTIEYDATTIEEMSELIFRYRKDVYRASQIGAASILVNNITSELSYLLHGNYSAVHAGPLYQALMADAFTASIDSDATVSVSLHPLPQTGQETSLTDSYNQDLVVTFTMIAIPFIAASFATFVVREREVKSKHLQLVSGVGIPSYWIATWLWDYVSLLAVSTQLIN